MQKLKGTKAGIPQKSKRLKNQSYTITSFQCTKKLEKNHRYSQEWTWMRRGIFLPIHFNSWSQVINTDQMLKFHKLKWIVILRGKKYQGVGIMMIDEPLRPNQLASHILYFMYFCHSKNFTYGLEMTQKVFKSHVM